MTAEDREDFAWAEIGRSGRAVYVSQPGRRFPSVCVQGDTVYSWLRDLVEVLSTAQDAPEREEIRRHVLELYAVVEGYAAACLENSDRVPFEWPDADIERALLRPGSDGV